MSKHLSILTAGVTIKRWLHWLCLAMSENEIEAFGFEDMILLIRFTLPFFIFNWFHLSY